MRKFDVKNYLLKKSLLGLMLLPNSGIMAALDNVLSDPSTPLSHCYHWLDEQSDGYLTKKYAYAKKNQGDVTFYTSPSTSNGAVAGPGLYCAKTPISSMAYGDRVIRLDLVDDVVMLDAHTGRKYCGHNGDYYQDPSECAKKPWDIKFYNGGGAGYTAWYVIRDPQAIARWSANSSQLEQDLLLNKQTGDLSYDQQADRTIQKMQAERASLGEWVIINHKARMNLVEILKDPSEAAKIPPLSLISRILTYSGDDLGDSLKDRSLKTNVKRALEDIYLDFLDIDRIIAQDKGLESLFAQEAIRMTGSSEPHKINIVASLLVADKYATGALKSQSINRAWSAILASDNPLGTLVEHDFKDDNVAAGLFSSIGSVKEIMKMAAQNRVSLLRYIDKRADSAAKISKTAPHASAILEKLFEEDAQIFAKTYDSLANKKLGKEEIAKSIFAKRAKTGFSGIDPIAVGNFLEQKLAGSLSQSVVADYKAKLDRLPLLVNGTEAYRLTSEYGKGNISLPSFMDESEFLQKVFRKAIAEKGVLTNPTNVYRFALSGYYDHFWHKISNEQDANKRQSIQYMAESFFFDLASDLSVDGKRAYIYPLMQNAATFAVDQNRNFMRYNYHPLEKFVERYGKGDAALDSLLEDAAKYSMDGSFLGYLFHAHDEDNQVASDLLEMALDEAVSDATLQYLKSQEFTDKNSEKLAWNNYIFNDELADAGSNRSKSDFCGFSNRLYENRRTARKILARSQRSDLDELFDVSKNMNCY